MTVAFLHDSLAQHSEECLGEDAWPEKGCVMTEAARSGVAESEDEDSSMGMSEGDDQEEESNADQIAKAKAFAAALKTSGAIASTSHPCQWFLQHSLSNRAHTLLQKWALKARSCLRCPQTYPMQVPLWRQTTLTQP